MRVTFVYPDLVPHVVGWRGYFHYGIGSVSAVLKSAGHQCSLIHITKPIAKGAFIETVKASHPDLIAFSSTSHTFPLVRNYSGWLLEERIDVPTICGGTHATIAPDECIRTPGIDMICRGEGEYVLPDLCRALHEGRDSAAIRNLWVKRPDGRVIPNPLRPVEYDLDRLPFADRALFDYASLYYERDGIACLMASRGCPFNCAYCCNDLKKNIYGTGNQPVRVRSVDNVIKEVREVLKSYPFIRGFNFDDDILLMDKKWSVEFAERYASEVGLPFMCNARADVTDEFRVGLLRKAGCYYVRLGLESGNQDVRFKVLNRRMTNAQIARAFKLCKDAGMTTHAYNIVGIPTETPAAILDTIKLNAQVGVDVTHVSIFQPYPGTRLAEVCCSEGLLRPESLAADFYSSSILQLRGVSRSQVLMFRDYFRAIMLCYRLLSRLPAIVSRFITRMFERCLSAQATAYLLNAIYLPCNYLYRRLDFGAGLKHRIAK